MIDTVFQFCLGVTITHLPFVTVQFKEIWIVWTSPYMITMIDYIGDIMVIEQDEQEVASMPAKEE